MNPVAKLIRRPVIAMTDRFPIESANNYPASLWNIVTQLYNFFDSIFLIPEGSDFQLKEYTFRRKK